MATEVASPIAASEAGARWPACKKTGWATSDTQLRAGYNTPSTLTTVKASNSSPRKAPVISAFVRTLRMAHSVVNTTHSRASPTSGVPGWVSSV